MTYTLGIDIGTFESKGVLVGARGLERDLLATEGPLARRWLVWALCGWIGFQFFSLWISGDGNNVAWWAHIGGFAAGVILVFLMRRPNAVRSST